MKHAGGAQTWARWLEESAKAAAAAISGPSEKFQQVLQEQLCPSLVGRLVQLSLISLTISSHKT